MITKKILLIDDNKHFCKDVILLLKDTFLIRAAENAKEGFKLLAKENFDAILLDLKLPDIYGIEVLKKIKSDYAPETPVIIVTDFGEIDIAVEAMKLGAYDFFQKDFNIEMIVQKINSALEKRDLSNIVKSIQQDQLSSDPLIFSCSVMQKINYEIDRVAMNDSDVLIVGESGVGKDIIAREIHKRSKRSSGPFFCIPIASLNENLIESELFGHVKGAFYGADEDKIGKFEAANNGTVYLPEISGLSENIQLKLLSFLQYKNISRVGSAGKSNKETKLNVKIIWASNDNLQELTKSGEMREDFYFRISGVAISVPPLRERSEDIEPLARYFLRKYEKVYNKTESCSITDEALKKLKNHSWKGNVRELENVIRNAFIFSGGPVFDELSFRFNEENDKNENIFKLSLKDAELLFRKDYFIRLLRQADNNKTKVAGLAGLSRPGLQKILKELGIE